MILILYSQTWHAGTLLLGFIKVISGMFEIGKGCLPGFAPGRSASGGPWQTPQTLPACTLPHQRYLWNPQSNQSAHTCMHVHQLSSMPAIINILS